MGNIKIELEASKLAAINFSYLLGGVGCNNYINSKSQNRIGVFFYPFGIQDRLIIKSF